MEVEEETTSAAPPVTSAATQWHHKYLDPVHRHMGELRIERNDEFSEQSVVIKLLTLATTPDTGDNLVQSAIH